MFDPTKPLNASEIIAAELREHFTGLKSLIDAVPAGPEGPPCEVTTLALLTAIQGTAQNPSGVETLSISISDPPTQGELQTVMSKLNELIAVLKRL